MTKTQSPIRARMIEQMKIGNLAPVTQKEYLRTVCNLARDTRAAPDRLDAEQVRAWVLGLIDRGLAPASTTGLRISETVAVQIADIKADRKLLHVRSGKGDVERMAPLLAPVIGYLRSYWQTL